MTEFVVKELTLNDLSTNLLQCFNRYQQVKRCWRMENNVWVLKDIHFIEQWDENLKKEVVAVDLTECLNSGGFVWGIFNDNNKLIAFASLFSNFFGSQNQYLQLSQLHVSFEYRNKGLGKVLFMVCTERARRLGAKKLYISAHSSEDSQHFYTGVGCVDAKEISKRLAEYEPYDRQMEFVL